MWRAAFLGCRPPAATPREVDAFSRSPSWRRLMIRLGNRIALVFGLAVACVIVPSTLRGQTTRAVQRPTFWGTIALGQAGITDSGMIHSSVGLSVQRHHLLVTGRATGNQQGQKGN